MAVNFVMRVPLYAVEGALEGLVAVDAFILRALGPRAPHLYDARIKYRTKEKMRNRRCPEPWFPADELLERGWGDCKDVAAYYAAWCRAFEAEPARVIMVPTRARSPRGEPVWHAVVLHSDGTVEDPSAQLRALEQEERLYEDFVAPQTHRA